MTPKRNEKERCDPIKIDPRISETLPVITAQPLNGFEDALTNLGGFSWFQIWAAFVILLPEIPAAMVAMMPIFVGTNSVQFPIVVDTNYTSDDGGQLNQIKSLNALDSRLCSENGVLVDEKLALMGSIVSIVQQWQLICSKAWLTDFFTSIQMMGMMTGAFTASQLADSFGRKTVYFAAVTTMGLFGIASGFSPNIYVYAVTKYFAGIGVGGFYVVYVIYLMEFLTPKWRTIAGCISIWCIGLMLLSLLSYLLPDWRHLTWAASSPALFILALYPLIPESPRWLLCKGRTMEAHRGLLQISKMNRVASMSIQDTEKLQMIILAENTKIMSTEKLGGNSSVVQLLTNGPLLRQLLLFLFGWFSSAFVYYGMSFNTKNLSGNPHLNVLYMALVDLPAFPSGVLFNNWLGRRKTYAGYWMFATISLVTLVLMHQLYGVDGDHSQGMSTWVTVLVFLGRFGVAGAWGIVMCFTAEAFPTVCRSTALGLGALFANIGGVLAPQLVFLGAISSSAPHFIFAALSLVSAATSFLLNETNQQPLKNFAK